MNLLVTLVVPDRGMKVVEIEDVEDWSFTSSLDYRSIEWRTKDGLYGYRALVSGVVEVEV